MVRVMSHRYRIVICCLLLSSLPGCTRVIDPNEAIASVNETNIQRLANLYFSYQMKNGWQGPDDEAEFKKFVSNYNPKKLARIGIDPDAIDDLFVSERDGQPFTIRYSVAGSSKGSSEPVIFETEGVDGEHRVGFLNMEQRNVDDAEYGRLLAGKASPQESARSGF